MLKKICVLAVAAAMFLPVLGTAQEKKGKKTAEERFAALDKNGDKKVSKEEYLAMYTDAEKKTKAETRFGNMDKDKDGNLSLEEFKEGTMKKK